MSTRLAYAVLFILAAVGEGRAQARSGGHWRAEHAVGLGEGATVLSRQQVTLEASSEPGECVARVALRLRRETELGESPQSEADLRQAQLECRVGAWLWSVGRQSVVWGKADAFPVLDAVHPFDMQEFVLQDRESIRRPLAMLRVERRLGEQDFLQALVMPEQRFDVLPQPGARFAETWAQLPALAAVTQSNRSEWSLTQPQWGAKWEHSGPRFGWTLNALRRSASLPVYQWRHDKTRWVAAAQRQWMLGGSVDLQAGRSVFRSEWAYLSDNPLPVADTALRYSSYDSTRWMLGVDRPLGEWLVGMQFFQQWHRGGQASPIVGRRQDWLTLLATRGYFDDRLRLRAFLTQDLRQRGTWTSLKGEWQWRPRIALGLQLDSFDGGPYSVYGQLEAQERANLSVQLDF